ncbi:response regulator [Myceligenerans pegani]|uniref:Response regulator transcription factor n=1 Tax=Myceligenerans pegani TaxID=2776917 RepID=A0ABR9N3H7_9MICO|nr:response regulator transcription factor [Myceligenerans sp. TRM 65318]MBE1877567.1 response regulator transcription factor [Myceligenerans sp. TRM 65318]MBE3019838.1 response regulator transcription factor [Myceligenerans sp. TRM 65318]
MTKVLIVDDDAFARTMIHSILTAKGIDVVGEADDGDQVPHAIARHRPDVVLIDLQMRRVDGVEAIRRNASCPGAPRFVALTGFGSRDAVVKALEAGAVGFLGKDDDPDALAGHVRAVADGAAALGPSAATTVIQRISGAPGVSDRKAEALAQMAQLTEREREVAALVAGRTNRLIARYMNLSENTVKVHLSSIMTKLGLESRDQIAVIVDRAEAASDGYTKSDAPST